METLCKLRSLSKVNLHTNNLLILYRYNLIQSFIFSFQLEGTSCPPKPGKRKMVTPVVGLQKSCGEFIHTLSFGELWDQKDTRDKVHQNSRGNLRRNGVQHCHTMKAAKSALSSDSGRQPPTIIPRSQCPGLP